MNNFTANNSDNEDTVRALYDFNSPDDAALSFKKNDVIKIWTKLESGWCHGECNGEKGWFPFNYVEPIDLSNDALRASFMRNMSISNPRYNTQNSHYSTRDFSQDRTQNWISQTMRTNDLDMTTNDASLERTTDSDFGESFFNGTEPNSRRPSNVEEWEPNHQISPLPHFNDDTLIPDPFLPTFSPPGNTLSDMNLLPTNWCKKISSSGRVYYFNMLTDESSWELSPNLTDVTVPLSKRGGGRRFSHVSQNSVMSTTTDVTWMNFISSKAQNVLFYESDSQVDADINWDKIVAGVVFSVHKLLYNIRRNDKSRFLSSASSTIEAIRIMLLASGTAEKDAPVFKSHQLLQSYHRLILSSLCDLILLAKVASGIWPPPDMSERLEKEALSVLIIARHFVQVAQFSSIGVKTRPTTGHLNRRSHKPQAKAAISNNSTSLQPNRLAPIRSRDRSHSNATRFSDSRRSSHDLGSETGNDSSKQSNGDIISKFDKTSRSTGIAIECLTDRIVQNPEVNQQLVTLVKLVIKEVGHFTGLLDYFSLEGVSIELSAMFSSYRQALYDNSNLLVLVTQTVTDTFSQNGSGSADQIITTVNRIEKSINDILIAIKFILEERDLKEYNELRRKLSAFSSVFRATIGRQQINGQTHAINQLEYAPPLRRCFSLTSLNSSVASANYSLAHHHPSTFMKSIPTEKDGGNLDQDADSDVDSTVSTGSEIVSRRDNTRNLRRGHREKLRKILGNDAPFPDDKDKSKQSFGKDGAPSIMVGEDKPWFLGHDYTSEELVFEGSKVRGGTIPGLVECLTFHDNWDPNFMATFLLTYRSFVTTPELFRLLYMRFTLEPPSGLNSSELEVWHAKKLTPIRLRVFNVFKTWVESYFQENEDMDVLDELRVFAATVMKEALPAISVQLLRHIEKRLDQSNSTFKKMVKNTQDEPIPIVPKNYNNFLEMDPLEIARQLTLIDSHLFNQIKPIECLNKAWSTKDMLAPNIKAMISMSTQISNWLVFTILSESNLRLRSYYIRHFINIAEKCLQLHNFNTLMSLLAGFNTTPIHRLRRTWELVNAKTLQTFDMIKQTMDSGRNFSVYRDKLHSVNPPCVPFLGLYLTDLTFIADGNSDNLKKSDLINFFKQAKSADIIREIQQYQNSTYYLKPLPKLQEYIKDKFSIEVNDTQFFDRSIELEPREREEEKIARLLQESGFL